MELWVNRSFCAVDAHRNTHRAVFAPVWFWWFSNASNTHTYLFPAPCVVPPSPQIRAQISEPALIKHASWKQSELWLLFRHQTADGFTVKGSSNNVPVWPEQLLIYYLDINVSLGISSTLESYIKDFWTTFSRSFCFKFRNFILWVLFFLFQCFYCITAAQ